MKLHDATDGPKRPKICGRFVATRGRGGGGGGGGEGAWRSGTLQEWPLYVPELHGEDIPKNHAVCIAVVPKRLCVCLTMAQGHQADVCLRSRCGMEGHVCFKSRAGMLDPNQDSTSLRERA